MLRLELRVRTWLLIILALFMVAEGAGIMEWALFTIWHGFALVAVTLDHGLRAVRDCGYPCKAG